MRSLSKGTDISIIYRRSRIRYARKPTEGDLSVTVVQFRDIRFDEEDALTFRALSYCLMKKANSRNALTVYVSAEAATRPKARSKR